MSLFSSLSVTHHLSNASKGYVFKLLDISLSEYLVRIHFGLFSFLALLAIRDPELSVRAAAEVRLPLTRPGHSPPVGGAKPQRAAANGNRAGGSRSRGTG